MKATYEAQGLTVIAVNLDAEHADADRFLAQFKPTFDVRFDPKGEFAEFYRIEGMPSSLLIDRHGVVKRYEIELWPREITGLQSGAKSLDATYAQLK